MPSDEVLDFLASLIKEVRVLQKAVVDMSEHPPNSPQAREDYLNDLRAEVRS